MEDWKEYKLGDICLKIGSGATPSGGKEAYKGGNFNLVRSQNVLDFYFSDDGLARINDEQAEKLKNVELHENDVLLNITGDSVARSCILPNWVLPARVNQHVCILRANPDFLDYRYLLYFIQIKKSKLLTMAAGGATRNALTKQMLEDFDINLPPLSTQQKIAEVLSSLDDKIELNNKINDNLEQQAQALFKSWFVDFEPFGGEMPEGWKVGKLSEIAEITTDTFSPDKNPNIDVEHYSLPAFDETKLPEFQKSEELKSNKFHITKDTVLVSKLNPTVKRVWRPYCLTEKSISSTEFIVFKPRNSKLRDFLFSIVNSQEFNDFMCSHVTGSTNSHQRTPPKTTLEYKIPLNCDEEIKKFCNLVTPMYDNIERNILENKKLSNLRDTLLPKLMNGEIL